MSSSLGIPASSPMVYSNFVNRHGSLRIRLIVTVKSRCYTCFSENTTWQADPYEEYSIESSTVVPVNLNIIVCEVTAPGGSCAFAITDAYVYINFICIENHQRSVLIKCESVTAVADKY